MKLPWLKILPVAVAVVVIAPLVYAYPSPTPILKPKADTISAVSSDSITVEHTKIAYTQTKTGRTAAAETSSKTYKITKNTEITIDDLNSTADKLQTGMFVTVQYESSSDAGKDSVQVATVIMARTAKQGDSNK